jgi:spore coat polysaccharide biosynthesis predicted glycosyltransferase SpsG
LTKKRVIFLTEGSRSMGNGHLTRCLALSQAFLERGHVSTFFVHGDNTITSILRHVEYEKVQWLTGIGRIKSRLQNAILVVDTFSITDELLNELSNISKVTVLDDFIRREHHNRLVVDWTINAENTVYIHKNPSSRYLLGRKYIALRRPFWDCPKFVIKPLIENVLITFGSGDIRHLNPRIYDILQKHYPSLKKTIIMGGASQSRGAIEALADSTTTIIVDANAEDMLSSMKKADIAIASGGQTLYELACVGVPTISVMLIDNQLDDINGWQKSGFTCHAGLWDNVNLNHNILSCFNKLEAIKPRQRASLIGQKLVDGQGARRISDIILAETHDC